MNARLSHLEVSREGTITDYREIMSSTGLSSYDDKVKHVV